MTPRMETEPLAGETSARGSVEDLAGARGIPQRRRWKTTALYNAAFVCSASGKGTTASSREATGEPSVGGSGVFFAKSSAHRLLAVGSLICIVRALTLAAGVHYRASGYLTIGLRVSRTRKFWLLTASLLAACPSWRLVLASHGLVRGSRPHLY
jgi:hypothetical protein